MDFERLVKNLVEKFVWSLPVSYDTKWKTIIKLPYKLNPYVMTPKQVEKGVLYAASVYGIDMSERRNYKASER